MGGKRFPTFEHVARNNFPSLHTVEPNHMTGLHVELSRFDI